MFAYIRFWYIIESISLSYSKISCVPLAAAQVQRMISPLLCLTVGEVKFSRIFLQTYLFYYISFSSREDIRFVKLFIYKLLLLNFIGNAGKVSFWWHEEQCVAVPESASFFRSSFAFRQRFLIFLSSQLIVRSLKDFWSCRPPHSC